jgi:sugar/nucleoside kinase (ribokinase family)
MNQSKDKRKDARKLTGKYRNSSGDAEEYVLVIGSAVKENRFKTSSEVVFGRKHVAVRNISKGGSGINFAYRLLARNVPVLPVLSLGDDSSGHQIKNDIKRFVEKTDCGGYIFDFLDQANFLSSRYPTPESIVIAHHDQLTTFTAAMQPKEIEGYHDHVRLLVDQVVDKPNIKVRAAVIGHIYGDDQKNGETTKALISRFNQDKDCDIYLNLGTSQILLGHRAWKSYLKKVGVFQLSLNEAKEFFKRNDAIVSLADTVKWLHNNKINAIITLGEIGAVAVAKDPSSAMFAPAIELGDRFKDSAAAGDAFGAGVAYSLFKRKSISPDLMDELEEGRLWAAFACAKDGSAECCPDEKEMREFISDFDKINPIIVCEVDELDMILRMR